MVLVAINGYPIRAFQDFPKYYPNLGSKIRGIEILVYFPKPKLDKK